MMTLEGYFALMERVILGHSAVGISADGTLAEQRPRRFAWRERPGLTGASVVCSGCGTACRLEATDPFVCPFCHKEGLR